MTLHHKKLDKIGVSASLLCAIHCALLPFVVTVLPLLGLAFLAEETTEWVIMGLAAALGFVSLVWGYRHHRSAEALALLPAAVALLVIGRLVERGERPLLGVTLAVLGGLALAAAHLLNLYLSRRCVECAAEAESTETL